MPELSDMEREHFIEIGQTKIIDREKSALVLNAAYRAMRLTSQEHGANMYEVFLAVVNLVTEVAEVYTNRAGPGDVWREFVYE